MKKLAFFIFLILIACTQIQEPAIVQPVVEKPVVQEPPILVTEEPKTPPVIETPPPGCVDTDGGVNKIKKGITRNQDDEVYDSCLAIVKEGRKIRLPKLIEYHCGGDDIVAEILDCPHGCDQGVCLPAPKPALPGIKLVDNGDCKEGLVANGIKVTQCYNDCLSRTACQPAPLDTGPLKLPAKLNCLVRTDGWVVEKWFEFDVLHQVNIEFFTEVIGSESVLVEVRDVDGNLITAPINRRSIATNKCFEVGEGISRTNLQPGSYQVVIGARAVGTDLLRSFRGIDFSVATFP